MTFIQSIKSVFSKYATFRGRASRSEYWWFVLFNTIVCCILSAASLPYPPTSEFIGMINSDPYSLYAAIGQTATGKILYIYSLAVILPTLAVSVRRLHDIGKGGGWIFINFVPVIGGIWYFILMLIGSQQWENRFGPKP